MKRNLPIFYSYSFFYKRNKQIGDLDEEYNNVASYDSDQSFSLDISNKTSEDKENSLSSQLKTSDTFKMPNQASCRTNRSTKPVIESKNIQVEKDFGFRNWCALSSKPNNLRYFVINDSQQTSITPIGNITINTNDSSSSDIMFNKDNNAMSSQILNQHDQSAIRFDSEMMHYSYIKTLIG